MKVFTYLCIICYKNKIYLLLGKRYYVLQLYFAIRQSNKGEQSENNGYTLIITSVTLKE